MNVPPPGGPPGPPPAGPPPLFCPICRGTQFQEEQARQDSRWGITSHRMVLLICVQCAYVLHFYDKRAYFFDFD